MIVVETSASDVRSTFYEGELISGPMARSLRGEGVAVLPCDPDLVRRGGISGWSKRSFGAGYVYDSLMPRAGASVALMLAPDRTRICWAARLVPTDGLRGGQLYFAGDPTQFGAGLAGLAGGTAVLIEHLDEPDAAGGWTIGGESRLTAIAGAAAPLGVTLYGTARGIAVRWLAASQVAP